MVHSHDFRIKNPLADLTKEQVLRDAEEFAQEHQLSHILPELRKGALVARDPGEFETVPDLTAVELGALRDEVLHKWRQPWALYFTIILCSVGAAVQYVTSILHGFFNSSRYRALLTHAILGAGIKPDPTVPIYPSQMRSAFQIRTVLTLPATNG